MLPFKAAHELSAGADDVLDELAADMDPGPLKKRPAGAAKLARKRRPASPAELAKSPRPLRRLQSVVGPVPNAATPADRPAVLQLIHSVRRSLATGEDAGARQGLLLSTGALSNEDAMLVQPHWLPEAKTCIWYWFGEH